MAMQTIFRTPQTREYLVLANKLINEAEAELKLDAIGLLIYLLSKPKDWVIKPIWLAKILNYSVEAIRRMLRSLKVAGYVIMNRLPSGKTEWFIYDYKKGLTIEPKKSVFPPQNSNNETQPLKTTFDAPLLEDYPQMPNRENPSKEKPRGENPSVYINKECLPSIEKTTNLDEKLALPEQLSQPQKQQAQKIITDAPTKHQQAILIVLATVLSKGTVKSPLGYLRALVSKANNGTFEALPNRSQAKRSRVPKQKNQKSDNTWHFTDLFKRFGDINNIPEQYREAVLAAV